MCHTDSVRQLDLTLFSQSCRYDILGNVTCCVCRTSVHLGAVLAGECSAAVTCISTVGVYDDLTASQSAVAVRSADYETSGRIDEELGVCIDHVCGQNRIEYILLDVLMDLLLRYMFVMLGRQNDCLQTKRLAILIILYGYLTLSVGS